MDNVMVFDHPLIQHKISILRNKATGTNEFRALTLGLVHAGREFVLHQKFNFYRFAHSSLL